MNVTTIFYRLLAGHLSIQRLQFTFCCPIAPTGFEPVSSDRKSEILTTRRWGQVIGENSPSHCGNGADGGRTRDILFDRQAL